MAVRHPQSTASHAYIIRMPPMPMRPSVRQVPRRRSQILGLEDGRSGLDLPGGQIGVRLLRGEVGVCWRTGGGAGSAGGQIGVRLLCVEGESVLEDGERGWIRPEGESA